MAGGNISLPACIHETMANLLQLDESSSDSDWVIYVKKDHKSSLVTGGGNHALESNGMCSDSLCNQRCHCDGSDAFQHL